jgi:hypothetical protein
MREANSCKDVAELLSQRLDEPLELAEELLLTLHVSLCSNCAEVQRQMLAIQRFAREHSSMFGAQVVLGVDNL